MRITFNSFILISLLAACNTKQSSETSSANSIDSTQTAQEETSEINATNTATDSGKIPVQEANLVQFPFAYNGGDTNAIEVIFSENGKVSHYPKIGGNENAGTWKLLGSTIQVAFDQDTASFEVQSFTKNKLVLITVDELVKKLFVTGKRDYGEYSGYYYIELHRLIFSAPYPEAKVSGSWQVATGACDFRPGGQFIFGDAECNANGTWKFDGLAFTIKLPENDCDWSTSMGTTLKVFRLSNGLMITRSRDGGTLTFRRAE